MSCRPKTVAGPEVDASKPLPALFAEMPQSVCPEAELQEVIQYLVKSKYLTIPEEWFGAIHSSLRS